MQEYAVQDALLEYIPQVVLLAYAVRVARVGLVRSKVFYLHVPLYSYAYSLVYLDHNSRYYNWNVSAYLYYGIVEHLEG